MALRPSRIFLEGDLKEGREGSFTGTMRTSIALPAVIVSALLAQIGCGSATPPIPEQLSTTPDQGPAATPDPAAAQSRSAASAAFSQPADSPADDAGAPPDSGPAPDAGPTCPPGAVTCSGVATNLHTDAANCGSCGHACGAGAWCSGGVCYSSAQRTAALSTSASVSASVDDASRTQLSILGDTLTFVADEQSVRIHRLAAGASATISSVLSPQATFVVSQDLFTDIGTNKTTFDFHVAESASSPFAYVPRGDVPLLSHVYAYGLVDVSDPSNPKHVSGLSTSGSGFTMTLPCDKATQCAACGCSCGCFALKLGATAADDTWTADGIDTVSETATTVTCSTYAPEGFVAAIAK
jgi:Stigma-specific protein, Stig1